MTQFTLMPLPTAIRLAILLCLVTLAGCQRGEVLGKVFGTVTYEGQAVSGAMVLFQDSAQGVHMMAPIDADGKFEVSMASGFGLPPGEYEIAVSPPPLDAPPGPITERPDFRDKFPNIPAKYRDPKTSGLKLRVIEGDNRFDIQMQAAKRK